MTERKVKLDRANKSIPVHPLSPLFGPMSGNWHLTCWCWSEPLRAVTALLRKLWDCKAKATHHYGAPQILCLMIENPFQ